MPVPSVTNRAAVKQALVDALRGHPNLVDVDVSHGWPGKHLGREHVWLARCTGEVTYPHVMADRKTRQDDYTVTVVFFASNPGTNMEEAEERVDTFYQALDDLAADGQVVSNTDSDVLGLEWSLHQGTVEGPDSELTDEGAVAFIVAEVAINARYR